MTNTVAKRGRGRPKGSRNKKSNLSTATVRQICEYHKFNPAEKLIRIANNADADSDGKQINWPLALQQRAAEKLFDAIHGKSALPGEGVGDGEAGQQFNLVFVESDGSFQLPREVGAESDQGALPAEPHERTGLPSSDGQDSVCDQLPDHAVIEVPTE